MSNYNTASFNATQNNTTFGGVVYSLVAGTTYDYTSTSNPQTVIGLFAFQNKASLTRFTIANTVTSIGADAFSSCSNLTSITIPSSVTTIGAFAFAGCRNLSSITIDNRVIGNYMFYNCTNLSTVTIPNSVTSVGSGAFQGSGVSSISIQNAIIGLHMFRSCSNLSTVTIPPSVTNVGSGAFQNCSNLSSITFNSVNIPPLGTNAFNNIKASATAYVPYGTSQSDISRIRTSGIQNVVVGQPPPCFLIGSKILTDKGYKLIEDLRKGDLVKTLKNDYLPIALIGKSPIYNSGDLERIKNRLYILPKHLFPSLTEDLVLTGCHSLLVDGLYKEQIFEMGGPDGRLYKTDDKLRLFTCFEPRAIPYQEEGTFTVYHLALESDNDEINFGIYANGLLVESICKLALREYSGMEFIE